MNQFRIVADSSCDLLTLDGADFVSVPLSIRTDAEEFYDDANLDVDAMVSTLRDTKGRSYSACPNIADWESAFGESGNVIAFTITSALSGSYNAACVAKKNCEERNPARRIYVVDSLSAGPEIALLIERALYELRSHADFDKVCEALNTYQAQTHLLFALESMHNLAQNGRVSKLAATMASVLGIRLRCLESAVGFVKRGSLCWAKWWSLATRAERFESGIVRMRRLRWSFAPRSSSGFRRRMCEAIHCGDCAAITPSAAGLCWALSHESRHNQ